MGNSQQSTEQLMDATMQKFKDSPEKCKFTCNNLQGFANLDDGDFKDEFKTNWDPKNLTGISFMSMPRYWADNIHSYSNYVYNPLFVNGCRLPGILYTVKKDICTYGDAQVQYKASSSRFIQCKLECKE